MVHYLTITLVQTSEWSVEQQPLVDRHRLNILNFERRGWHPTCWRSTRARPRHGPLLFRGDTSIASFAQREFPQHFPADGQVEHEPEDLWATTVETCRSAMREAGAGAGDIVAIGIANQRETTLLWHRTSGRPVHRAIVWQDRRTADMCARLKAGGHERLFTAKTGLLLDPYFSGTKLAWLLQQDRGHRRPRRARRARLRNGRYVPVVASHRRQSPRHRCNECVAHAVVRYSRRTLGR